MKEKNKNEVILKILSIIYCLSFILFIGIVIYLDILPKTTLILFCSLFTLFSILLIIQLRSSKIKKFVKILGSFVAFLLIITFFTTSTYALQTLAFLNNISTNNSSNISNIVKEPFNICITGIDVDGEINKQGRSDVNMIVTVNPNTEQILLTSIPRDYEIYLADYGNAVDKLTHTGFIDTDTTIKAEENLLDIDIDQYIKINFSTVTQFIDAIGGVDVYSEYEFTPVKMKDWTVKKGINHMNGKQALAFARERKAFTDGDIQRTKNQQAVFEAIIKKSTSSKTLLFNYTKILSSLENYFEMSFNANDVKSFIKLQILKSPKWKIYKNTLIGGDAYMPTYSMSSFEVYVMSQNQESIDQAKKLINGILSGNKILKDEDGNLYLESKNITKEKE